MITGINFPVMFEAGSTKIVSGIDKIKADLQMLIRTQIRTELMNPRYGIDLESILFTDDVMISRDFLFTFLSDAVSAHLPEVTVKDVTVTVSDGVLDANVRFLYREGESNVNFNYGVGDLL